MFKRIKPLLLFIGLVIWSCATPPTVTIQTPIIIAPTVLILSPLNNQTINEIVTIVVETEDNDGIDKVEFYIDDSLLFTDLESFYEYQWNTIHYEDDSKHTVKVISYDLSGHSTISESHVYVIDNSTSHPQGVNIISVSYTVTEMTIEWEGATDQDFKEYKVLYSSIEGGDKDTIISYSDKSRTTHILTDFDPAQENWFWVDVLDIYGLSTLSGGMTNEIDDAPTSSDLYPISLNDEFQIMWSKNKNNDFSSYKLYKSFSEDMSNQVLVYETNYRTDTTFVLSIDVLKYYQLVVEDFWGIQSKSNIEIGDYEIKLWGEYYSIVNTVELNLIENQLTGNIPPEIEILTNLTGLFLSYNYLRGEIPSEIGNLRNLTELHLGHNGLEGEIPPEIGNLANLTYLSLWDNELTGSIPREIGNLANLTYLSLWDNKLTGSIPRKIGNLVNLTYLSLWDNELTGSIPPEIGNLNNLIFLSISENKINGKIPLEIGNLIHLHSLGLFNNELTGSIPSEIGNLTNLTYLGLFNNELTGGIPSEIWELKNMEFFRLENNQLINEIPESMCELDFNWSNTTFFNISNNQFSPPYPECVKEYITIMIPPFVFNK
jgi:Leucine-rich repeat (LRR) protein